MKPSQSNVLRVASNYFRLLATCLIGVLVIRVLLRFGDQAYGLIALLGTGSGLALVFKEIVRSSTIPVLGEAFHSSNKKWFEEVYNSAMVCSFAAAIASLIAFAIFAVCLPFFTFPPELYHAALVFVIAAALHSFSTVASGPLLNFYVVSERMVPFNVYLMFERLGDVFAAVLTLYLIESTKENSSSAIISYGILAATFGITTNLAASALIVREEPILIPNPFKSTRKAFKVFLSSAGWNSCTTFAMNLYARTDMLIMNLYFGLFGNMVFSIANQAVGYVRQIVLGLVSGVDAVAARVAGDGEDAIVSLFKRLTQLQAMIVFPAMVVLMVTATPLVEIWLSGRLEDPEATVPAIVSILRILIFGVAARCLSEGWTWVMNGAGKIKKYATVVLTGGLLNPLLAILAIYLLPMKYKFSAPALVFSLLIFSVNLVGIPRVVAREYGLTFREVIQPMFSPALVSVACWCTAWLAFIGLDQQLWSKPIYICVLFSILYVLACYIFVLKQSDKAAIMKLTSKLASFKKQGRE